MITKGICEPRFCQQRQYVMSVGSLAWFMTRQIMINSELRRNPENPILVKTKSSITVFVHQLSNLQERKPPLSHIHTHTHTNGFAAWAPFLLVDRIATLERIWCCRSCPLTVRTPVKWPPHQRLCTSLTPDAEQQSGLSRSHQTVISHHLLHTAVQI